LISRSVWRSIQKGNEAELDVWDSYYFDCFLGLKPVYREEIEMKKLFEKVKKNVTTRLEKLAEENRKTFGGKRLDCCSINRKPVTKVKTIK